MSTTLIEKPTRKALVAPTRRRVNVGATTRHRANIGGHIVNYTVTLAKNPAYTPPKNKKNLSPTAEIKEGGTLEAVRLFNHERHLLACATADLIEQNPELAISNARQDIKKFRTKIENFQVWYREWDAILENWTPQEICAYLRDEKHVDSGLRLSVPYFGKVSAATIAKIVDTVYGQPA